MNRRGKLYFRYGMMVNAKTAIPFSCCYNFEDGLDMPFSLLSMKTDIVSLWRMRSLSFET